MSVGISAAGVASSTSLTVGPAHGFCAGVSAVGALNVGLDIVGTASSTSLAVGPAIGCSTTVYPAQAVVLEALPPLDHSRRSVMPQVFELELPKSVR